MSVELGELIRKKRLKKGLSMRKLGDLVGVSGVEISRIEKGERLVPSAVTIAKIGKVLDIDVNHAIELIDKGEQKSEVVSEEEKVTIANDILDKYNTQFRFAQYDLDSEFYEPSLVVKYKNKSVDFGLISIDVVDEVLYFFCRVFPATVSNTRKDWIKSVSKIDEFIKDIQILNDLEIHLKAVKK